MNSLNFYRSEASGNCLYSSVSLMLVGDNSLVGDLRAMTSIELYLNANFYSDHPHFLSSFDKHKVSICQHLKNILPMCVSYQAVDCSLTGDQLVKKEAILNCSDKTWSSFLCILALASVTNRNVFCYYPDCGEDRFKLLFNCMIEPCPPIKAVSSDLHILFCFEGIVKAGQVFKPNNFVPLIFQDSSGNKRKLQRSVPSNLPKQMCSNSSKVVGDHGTSKKKQSKLSFPTCTTSVSMLPVPPEEVVTLPQ